MAKPPTDTLGEFLKKKNKTSPNDEKSGGVMKLKLSKLKMQKLKSSSKDGSALPADQAAALASGELVIAPLTSNMGLPSIKKKDNGMRLQTVKPGSFKASTVKLPENWNNYTAPKDDASNIKYKLSTRPLNQQRCGSCFAFASATTISDVFIWGKNLNYNPELSPMAIMSCIPETDGNAQCNGGHPIQVLTSLAKNGVVSNRCIDYDSICTSSDHCKQSGKALPSDMKIPECGGTELYRIGVSTTIQYAHQAIIVNNQVKLFQVT